jgi:flavin reductase (DIM6/NTAB) family NADH-FMN oxidoreductase RutF
MKNIAHPRQVIVVTSRSTANILGKDKLIDNAITLAWHSPLSFEPKLYGIVVGKKRFSYKLIKESKVFVVNFMKYEQKDAALHYGRTTGQSTDKFADNPEIKEDCDTIDCFRLKNAVGFMECELIDEIEAGDHVMFIGKIQNERLNEESKRLFHKGGDEFTYTV